MSAYLIACVDIHDRRRFTQDYVPPVAAALEPFGGRVVAVPAAQRRPERDNDSPC
jgi:uncharacterized protein (DUF1330 family)